MGFPRYKPVVEKREADKIIKDAASASDKKTHSFYLSKSVVKEFETVCEGAPVSRVLESLMRDFIKARKA